MVKDTRLCGLRQQRSQSVLSTLADLPVEEYVAAEAVAARESECRNRRLRHGSNHGAVSTLTIRTARRWLYGVATTLLDARAEGGC